MNGPVPLGRGIAGRNPVGELPVWPVHPRRSTASMIG